mgnify:CR=1 FL=1
MSEAAKDEGPWTQEKILLGLKGLKDDGVDLVGLSDLHPDEEDVFNNRGVPRVLRQKGILPPEDGSTD